MNKPTVGIVGTGIYIPAGRMTAKEISQATMGVWSEQAVIEKLGIRKKQFPEPMTGHKKWVFMPPWMR
jgi:3-oxoacyl-[acyl-carrier-protein] synthase-3